MESVNNCEAILANKIDNYKFDEKNFVIPNEITVTITLGEYRELVKGYATAELRIKNAVRDKLAGYEENKKLKEENARLKAEANAKLDAEIEALTHVKWWIEYKEANDNVD